MTKEEAIRHGKEQLEIFSEGCEHYEFIKMAIKALEQPSHENKIIDEHYWKGFNNGIRTAEWRAIKQEPSGDAVSRQAVFDLIEHYNSDGLGAVFIDYRHGIKFADAINDLPSVNPQEPKTGHWIVDRSLLPFTYTCDICGRNVFDDYDYCPYCGARMEGSD